MIRTTRSYDALARSLASATKLAEGDSRLDRAERWRQATTGRADSGRLVGERFSLPGFLVIHRTPQKCIFFGDTIVAKVMSYMEGKPLTLEIASTEPMNTTTKQTFSEGYYRTLVTLPVEGQLKIQINSDRADAITIIYGKRTESDKRAGAKLILEAPANIKIARDDAKRQFLTPGQLELLQTYKASGS